MRAPKQQISVVLYTRETCGLCRDVDVMLRNYVKHDEVTVVDIDTDDALLKRYALRIPVVTINGEEVAEGQITDTDIREVIRAAKAGAPKTRRSRWQFWA